MPHHLTSFIGREHEIAEVRQLLHTTRLLTLTGTGGVGKTRLGHEVAASLLDPALRPGQGPCATSGQPFQDGIWLVELAALADETLVPQAVATALGVAEEAESSTIASLVDALCARQLLLILDNCEHLIAGCAAVANALLRASPGLRILATSRQPLGITGEITFRVPSLSLPLHPRSVAARTSVVGDPYASAEEPAQVAGSIDHRRECEAIRLFVDRARAAVPDLTLTDQGLDAVEQICRRLDGIPLAIELAAARVAFLTPQQIAARVGNRLSFLTGGSETALLRYRTLRALVDSSHDLLNEQERILFRRLAVFVGGWTLDAAEAVCAGDGLAPEAGLAPDAVLDALSGLTAKSLVVTGERTDEVRYRLLESLREYAAEKLRDAGEETLLRARHCAWLLARAERAEPELRGPRSVTWVDRLERERENLRAAPPYEAIEYALSSDAPAASLAALDAPQPPDLPTLGGLSQRELEVAALVARGLSNRQIAAELMIADGTATNHVKHILTKLMLDSRVQIAAWAFEHGLHRRSAS